MPHDPARVADTKAWLTRAATDLRAAAIDLAADPPVLDDLVFHCQQAVEKTIEEPADVA
jgi:HEPN domain-containing protein